jgi:DNA polymerase elongation subunit (family B)
MGVEAGLQITKLLKAPHDLEYEKTFSPFILLSKKRYVGLKYEFDLEKYKQTSMGIVLKRRDNAKIVKYIYGGAIDIIMKEKNFHKAIDFVKKCAHDLVNGKFGMDYLIITKSLRAFYKNPDMIAHKVLADRMGERDPGNKPKSNDRIPYVYIVKKETKRKKLLQGDKIETPEFIKKNNLEINYLHYITNQVAKPVCQVFALELEKIPSYDETLKLKKRLKNYENDKTQKNIDFIRAEREKIALKLLFGELITTVTNQMNKQKDIRSFFKKKKPIIPI